MARDMTHATTNPVRVFQPQADVFVVLIDLPDGATTTVADRFTFDPSDWGARNEALRQAKLRAKWWRRQNG